MTIVDWETWQSMLIGEQDEDLRDVIVHLRPQLKREKSRQNWALDPRTRMFCDLALHFLYRYHIAQEQPFRTDSQSESKMFQIPGGTMLEDYAGIVAPRDVHRLGGQFWKDNWKEVGAFRRDLIEYLFRPSIYIRRIRTVRALLLGSVMSQQVPLGRLLSDAAEQETQQVSGDHVVALQTFIQVALPASRQVERCVRTLEDVALSEWATTYEAIFSKYGIQTRDGRTWRDIAELFSTLAEGAVLRARTWTTPPRLSDGSNILGAGVLAMIPRLLEVSETELMDLPPVPHRAS